MSELVKRSQLRHFLNIGTKTEPKWRLIGDGVTELEVTTNPETDTEQYIHQDTQTTFLKNYAPTIDGTQTARKGDDVFDYIDELSWKLPVGADAESQIVEVRLWRDGDAKMWNCNLTVNSYGGPATDPNSHTFSINIEGDAIFGDFDLDSLEFTAGAARSNSSASQTITQAQEESLVGATEVKRAAVK